MNETYKASGKAIGSTYITYEGLSKREVIKVIRDQLESNRFTGNTVQWTVYRRSDGAAVAAGGMDSTGRRYRLDMERGNDKWTVYPIINGCSQEPCHSGTNKECREYMMRATTLRPCAEFIMLKDE